ncbi:hypothetical protein HDV62DRAFT_285697 [Trichoderma sp. SZMC 28011]
MDVETVYEGTQRPEPPDVAQPQVGSDTVTSGGPNPTGDVEASAAFRESKICIAVDMSGSTYDGALEAEKHAIRSVCSLIPRGMHENITIIPWNDQSHKPRPLSGLDTLSSEGGTDPNVILDDPECRLFLQDAGFWFLMTDGEIADSDVHKFARNLSDYGMHGKACIIAVFGEKVMKPSDCHVSVGLAVFAISPHVAFLYTDSETHKTSLLATKGCFSNLLHAGKRNPKLDYDTTWDDLPRVSYEDLTRVSVPAAQTLGKDEIALQGETRINIPALLEQETVDENIMRQIMLNEDNIKTVALAVRLRGESDKLAKWLDKVDKKLDQEESEEHYEATMDSQLLKDIAANLDAPETGQPQRLLRKATAVKLPRRASLASTPSPSYGQHVPMYSRESTTLGYPSRIRQNSFEMRIISNNESCDSPQGNLSGGAFEYLDQPPSNPPQSSLGSWGDDCQSYRAPPELEDFKRDGGLNLAVAGFLRPAQEDDQFLCNCPICNRERTVLALVFKTSPRSTVTENFPKVGCLAKLIYPLTMGNYPETDIIADTIACDSCAASMAKAGVTPLKEQVTTVLPLVSYSRNQDPWLQTLNIATERRFNKADLPQVFLGILITKRERLVSDPSKLALLQDALRWASIMIPSEVVLQGGKSQYATQFGAGQLQEVILRNFRDSLLADKFPQLLSYPLDGFIVANAALSNSSHARVLTQEKRKSIVMLRFLYHLLENCRTYEQDNGLVQLHAAKALVLLMDDPSGPRSLFKWTSLRYFSFSFDSVEDMRKYMMERIVMNRYRLSLTITDLLDTPLLSAASLAGFRRLGPLFSWIESEAGHSIAVFVHYLLRLDVGKCPPDTQFRKLRERSEVKEALDDPGLLSARHVERLIKPLPLLNN